MSCIFFVHQKSPNIVNIDQITNIPNILARLDENIGEQTHSDSLRFLPRFCKAAWPEAPFLGNALLNAIYNVNRRRVEKNHT